MYLPFSLFIYIAEDEEDDGRDGDPDEDHRGSFNKRSGVLKNSFASAFQSIINKKIDEDKIEEPILAKYKRPAKEVTEELRQENELK